MALIQYNLLLILIRRRPIHYHYEFNYFFIFLIKLKNKEGMESTCVALVLILSIAMQGHSALPPAPERANMTVRGLFQYFWSQDPVYKNAWFFFACGQIGGGGGYQWTQCSCGSAALYACVPCYRWFDAVALEAVATYGIYSGTKDYSESADHIYNHSPYNAKWNPIAACTFMDDFSWYGLAYLRVYEWLKVSFSN